MDVEQGAYKLLIIAAVGIALVILAGVGYTNYSTSYTNVQSLVTCTGVAATNGNVLCSTNTANGMYANAINVGVVANFSKNGGAITNTAGSNSNYVYYILFMALVIAVVIGALVAAVKTKRD